MKLFSSKYSLCLYEIFVDYQNIWQTPIIPLDDFKKLMGVDKEKYKEFKRLSSRVIKPAVKELISIGGYDVQVVYTKENKKVTALKFQFKELKCEKKPMQDMKLFHNIDLQQKLVQEFWLSLRQAKKTIKTYPIPYINESLAIIKHKLHQKLIKNIPAYTLTVLKNDFHPTLWNQQKEPVLSGAQRGWAKTRKTKQNWLENSKSTVSGCISYSTDDSPVLQTQKKALKHFYALWKKEQEKCIKEFKKEKITSDILQTIFKKEGIEGMLMQAMFVAWLEKKEDKAS